MLPSQDIIIFDPNKQSLLSSIACNIVDDILWKDGGRMPKIPFLSLRGQIDAFDKVVEMIISHILSEEKLAYDENARSGTLFWSLTLIVANNKKFKAAIAAAKRDGPKMYETGAFLQWFGTEVPPAVAIMINAQLWDEMRKAGGFSQQHWTKDGLKELSK